MNELVPHLVPKEPSTEEMRVTKSPLEIVLLDDIAGQLFDLLKLARDGIPSGAIEPLTLVIINLDYIRHKISYPWFAYTITNDGPNSVDFVINNIGYPPNRLNPGETLNFDFKKANVNDIWIKLAPGGATATVRMYGTY